MGIFGNRQTSTLDISEVKEKLYTEDTRTDFKEASDKKMSELEKAMLTIQLPFAPYSPNYYLIGMEMSAISNTEPHVEAYRRSWLSKGHRLVLPYLLERFEVFSSTYNEATHELNLEVTKLPKPREQYLKEAFNGYKDSRKDMSVSIDLPDGATKIKVEVSLAGTRELETTYQKK